jgi:hypothetical protein
VSPREFHLDDARFAKDRWRLGIHAGSVTVAGKRRLLSGLIVYLSNHGCDEYALVWHWRRKATGDARNGMSGVARRSGAANARRKRRGRRDERADAAAEALVTGGKSLWRRAGVVFTENTAIRHSDTRNARSPRSVWRIFCW